MPTVFKDVLSNSLLACPVYQGYGGAIVNEKSSLRGLKQPGSAVPSALETIELEASQTAWSSRSVP